MKTKIEILENSHEWNVPAKGDESHKPNKYRERPDVDEMGVVEGTDAAGVFVAGIACLFGILGLLAGVAIAVENLF